DTFFSEGGLPKHYFPKKFGQQRKWLRFSLSYFNNDASLSKTEVPPTITPYAIKSRVLAEICEAIELRAGSVYNLFADPSFAGTEFYLIFSFLLSRNESRDFSFFDVGTMPATIFATWPESSEDFDKVLRWGEKGRVNTFGLHYRRNRLLTLAEWRRVQRIWREAEISDDEANDFYEERICAGHC